MKKKSILALVFCFFCGSIFSQFFSIEDIELGRKSYLEPADIQGLQWMGESDNLCLIRNDSLLMYSVLQQQETVLLTLNQLNKILDKSELSETESFPEITAFSGDSLYFTLNSTTVILNLQTKELYTLPIPEEAEGLIIGPEHVKTAYTIGQNVFIRGKDKEAIQLTNDIINGILNGSFVYRHEFGMEEGMFWSPGGNYLAFYKKDESQVTNYPLVDIQERIAKVENTRYPMAGMTSEETEIWVYSVSERSLIKLATIGEPDSYHTNLSWTPDEKHIYMQHLNRDQDKMILCCYSAQTGSLEKELFMETNKKYVEPMNPLIFSEKKPGDFLYQSERDGYNHIYYYKSSSKKLEQLTKGEWEVTKVLGFDESEMYVFFMATKESPLESHFYKYDMVSKSITKLTSGKGTHAVTMNSNKTLFIDTYSGMSIPRIIRIADTEGKVQTELLNAPNPLSNYSLGEVTIGTILAADHKTSLYYRLTLPVDFDSTKKYPVIIYVYGGPHIQLISDTWLNRTDYLHQYYAQHGIVSFELDCRGSDLRGRKFEDVIYRQLGIPQMEDQFEGVKFLEEQPWIDTSRIGVQGWSFGGFMTITMMLHYPDIFKVGVAGGPVTDWKYYEVMYGERYMDTPEQNPEGYEETDVNKLAGNLKGKLLVIHGALDETVVWQNSLVFLEECIDNNKQVDYFVYPLDEHNVKGNRRVHLTEMSTQYFLDNL